MDALAQLAVMTKAKAVFESDDTFLSFPALTPLSYPADSLSFAASSAPSPQQLRMMSEFSRLANSLPTGTLFEPTPGQYLWDAYQAVLQTAIVANGDMTADQKAVLAAAEAILHVTTPDGLRSDSPMMVAYKQCRDAWFKAVQDYNARKSTAEASTDPAAQAQWKNTDEPMLRAAVDAANLAWAQQGNKDAVEAAQQQEATAAAQSPRQRWRSWASQFVPDIDVMTDPDNESFALTAFTPAEIVEHDDWPSFTLTAPEISRLVSQAPHELVAIFGEQPGASAIDALSFEYRSVSVTRPWFHPELFAAHFWKLPAGSNPLSNGATPPTGDWPAYVTAVVFARNIVVHPHASAAGPAPAVRLHAFLPIIRTTAVPVQTAVLVRVAHPVLPPHPAVPVAATATRPPVAPAGPLRAAVAPAGRTAAPPAVHPPIATAMLRLNPALPAHVILAAPRPGTPPGAAPAPAARPQPSPTAAAQPHLPQPQPAPAAAPAKTQTESAPEISILAFICKRLPASPNPDATLDWTA
jgi:hypothetical protein